MADANMNFRSALNGFNRSDVVQFIQNKTNEFEREKRNLQAEIDQLLEELDAVREQAEELRVQNSALAVKAEETQTDDALLERLQRQLRDSQEMIAQLQEELVNSPAPSAAPASPSALDAPMVSAQGVTTVGRMQFDEMELAAYRRAELTERLARERAEKSAQRVKTAFAQADEKLALTSQDLAVILDGFEQNFEQLQQALLATQSVFQESVSTLQAAADLSEEV
ncbi:MAG: hypothetical protein LBM28_06390 [Oscillospiraceae bacterium]|jgi:chromosome segregation ATPase|nr:hypothetical protein [Oscillospiraceae bacterium]